MEPVLYSWLGAAAIAPFVAILSAWTLVVFRSYRRRWRVVDLFLFALTAHEVVSALFGFGFAVLSLIRPVLDAPCGFIVWGLTATRTFHLSAVTSLLVDRALTVRWPYTYRLSVRSSQVRYHVVVLAIISVFVGVTAVFARVPGHTRGFCSIHPLAWDAKFSVFLASVYGMLLLTGFACCLIVQAGRMRIQGSKEPCRPGRESGCSTSSSNSSRPLQPEWREFQDLGWRVVASVSWLSCILNHGPFLVMTIMGTVVPTFWSPWLDNTTIWLRLAQGTLVPLMLLLTDLPHRSALRNMLRQPGRIYRHLSDHGGFRMQVGDLNCPKSGILPSLMMYSGEVRRPMQPFPMPQRLRWAPHMLPSLQALQPEKNLRTCKTPSDTDSITKWNTPFPDQHIYASLGSSYSTSLRSSDSKIFLSCSDDGGSITTDAIDDFEFHGSLPKRSVSRDGQDMATNETLEPHLIFRSVIDHRKFNSNDQQREREDINGYSYSEEEEDADLHRSQDATDLEPSSGADLSSLSPFPNTETETEGEKVTLNVGLVHCKREFILHPCIGSESPFTAHLQEPPFVDSSQGDSGEGELAEESSKRNQSSPVVYGGPLAERIRRFQEASAEDDEEEEEDEDFHRRSQNGNQVVSMNTMLATLEAARFSYLDNGDLCTHRPCQLLEQRVIFSDYV